MCLPTKVPGRSQNMCFCTQSRCRGITILPFALRETRKGLEFTAYITQPPISPRSRSDAMERLRRCRETLARGDCRKAHRDLVDQRTKTWSSDIAGQQHCCSRP